MNIGIDVDGVLINFEEIIRYRAEIYDIFERKNNKIKTSYNYTVESRYDWNEEDWKTFSDKYLLDITKETHIMIGAKEILALLKNRNHKLIIVSSRGDESEEMITLVENKFKQEHMEFDKCYWKVKNKLDIIKNEKIDIIIDDNPNVCKQLSDKKIKTLYFRNIYGRKLPDSKYLIEVKNWAEVYRYIEKNV